MNSSKSPLSEIEREVAILLRYAPEKVAKADPEKARKNIQARLVAIGCGDVCGRCGGSGEYSWCQAYGSTCFKCGGSGYVVQKITPKVIERAKESIAQGRLDQYMDYLRAYKAMKPQYDEISSLNMGGGVFPIIGKFSDGQYDMSDPLTALMRDVERKLRPMIRAMCELASAVMYRRDMKPQDRQAKVFEFDAKIKEFKSALQEAKQQLREAPDFSKDRIYYANENPERYDFFFNDLVNYHPVCRS